MRRLACIFFLLWPFSAVAQDCRLALLLGLDVSSSVNAEEDTLQRKGLAAALISPDVQKAFFAVDLPVALAVFEWSGRYNQELLFDWHLISTPEDLLNAAGVIGQSVRSHSEFPTAMGYALGYGARLMTRAPSCLFRTIDIAGDGINNEGFGPEQAYQQFPFADVTVNGLVVNNSDYEAERSLISFYRDTVLYGPGAFLEIAQSFEDYERAMRRKLEREVTPRAIGLNDFAAQPYPG